MAFIKGQLIPVAKLNELDNYIKQLELDQDLIENNNVIKNIIILWNVLLEIPNDDSNNIQDNITRIKEKQQSYINFNK